MNPGLSPPLPRATTRVFGLLGHPVSHSLSPLFQNAALRELGLDACYLAFDVLPEALTEALAGARVLGVAGLNVTVPHKEQALRLAAEADPLAELVGAANTLMPVAGGWKAFNTDVAGFLQALEADLQFRPAGRRALIVGAGGAARAAAVALLQDGIQEIFLANRNRERATRLAQELGVRCGGAPIRTVGIGDPLPTSLGSGDVVVDSTPVGLQDDGQWPWDLRKLGADYVVYDMAYRSGETPLVRRARAAGFRASSGRRMLLYQGAVSFTLWTGLAAPLAVMESALNL
jgi:shikimate dehydrogenase